MAVASIGENLIYHRAQARLTRDELAVKSGVTYNTIWRTEEDLTTPSVPTLRVIADALGVGLYDLLAQED